MFISERAKCIFVHIQKTGGVSVEAALRQHEDGIGGGRPGRQGRQHMFATELRTMVRPDQWRDYYKFAFVRNPWDRLVSWYHMCMQAPETNAFGRHIKENAPTFEAFLTTTTTGIAQRTTYNQLDYVADGNGELIVDFVGRYERLREDFAVVRARVGLAHNLPHINRSTHADYRVYYSDTTREIVARRFARDIGYFGYAF
ncbi:MAG: sulfotransferase family 2 domain-containing protein [Betaproteobacteria bacterium]